MAEDREEQYVLRVQDRALADRLRQALRSDQQAGEDGRSDTNIEIKFSAHPRHGEFVMGDDRYPVVLQDLPGLVESYKTYDDVNLVKSNDVGQMLVVGEKDGSLPEGVEARHGITPPMRDARRRHFRQPPQADPQLVSQVEDDLLTVLAGGAPPGVEFLDIEEQYMVDEATGRGEWRQVQKKAPGEGSGAKKERKLKIKPVE